MVILSSSWRIRAYCYTARSDLDFSGLRALTVNASGNWTKSGVKGQFRMLQRGERIPKGMGLCPMDCTICSRCMHGKRTCVKVHA